LGFKDSAGREGMGWCVGHIRSKGGDFYSGMRIDAQVFISSRML
jgi:hypothetical protein